MVGALVGFIFSFLGGVDPEILKIQAMIRETQSLIVLGNKEIMDAIRRLDSKEAKRNAEESISIL